MARPSSGYSKREQTQSRCFSCILYESDDIELKLNRLPFYWDKFYYIRHDRDTWLEEDVDEWLLDHPGEEFPYDVGSLKKPHYHCIGYTSPCLLGRAAIKFDIPSNLVRKVKNKKGAIRYLIHLDNPNKYQYAKEEIITNDPDIEEYLKTKMASSFKAQQLIDFINSTDYVSFHSLSIFAITNDCWDELRRGQHIFTTLLNEHNRYGGKNES